MDHWLALNSIGGGGTLDGAGGPGGLGALGALGGLGGLGGIGGLGRADGQQRSGPGSNVMGSPQTRPVTLGLPQYAAEFPSPEAAKVAAELQFFHPQSFFGEAALGSLQLESLEDDALLQVAEESPEEEI